MKDEKESPASEKIGSQVGEKVDPDLSGEEGLDINELLQEVEDEEETYRDPVEFPDIDQSKETTINALTKSVETRELDTKTMTDEYQYGLNCNVCSVQDSCPLFEVNSVCRINFQPNSTDPTQVFEEVLKLQLIRLQRGLYLESQKGGALDPQLSAEFSRIMNMLQMMKRPTQSLVISASGGDAVNSLAGDGKGGGGLLSQLFGNKDQ